MKQARIYMAHARTKEQRENMEQIKKDKVDPFDWKHFSRYHAAPILRKGTYWLVTPNDFPYEGTKLHFLFVYRDAIRTPSKIAPKGWIELGNHIKWVEKKFKLPAGTLVMRFGEPSYTGASIHHLHAHIVVGGKRKKNAKKLKVSAGYHT